MKELILPLALVLLAATVSSAQWLDYPSPGIPRLRDGTANLDAPPPRTANGTPDLSGIWVLEATIDFGLLGQPLGPEFGDIGASLEDGLPYQGWAAARVEANRANIRANDPLSHCLAIGPIRSHTFTGYRRMIQLPDRIVILNEYNASYRQMFTDGRPLPSDPDPSWNGYSSGSWEGDTLVIESVGFHDGLWLDSYGSPLTEAARITEKFRRPVFGRLEIELTVDDPEAYTEPWTVTLHQRLVPDTELVDAICAEEDLVRLQEAERSGGSVTQ